MPKFWRKKHKSNFFTFQDINFIYKTRISRINKTINNSECTSRICRFTSIRRSLLRTMSVLSGDMNNNQQESQPLLHESHDHHRTCKCSCLPSFFNCCFLVSWTFLLVFILYWFDIPKNDGNHDAAAKARHKIYFFWTHSKTFQFGCRGYSKPTDSWRWNWSMLNAGFRVGRVG